MDSVVCFKKVSKHFDEHIACDQLDFSIGAGEFFSLLGPSGCGKTTTLRLIAGFEQPTEGEILLEGKDVSGVPAFKRNVNTVFQSYALFPHLDVFENVAFGLRRKNIEGAELEKEVRKSLALVRMESLEKRRIQQLSGGQQQRVALARALVNKPSVLLLDEPMAALDSRLKQDMRVELKNLQRHLGITFVLVTHDQEEALTMSDRVAVLSEGKLQQVSPPEELYRRPQNKFVAEFIGRANFLPVSQQGKSLYFEEQLLAERESGGEGDFDWMLRPESIKLGPSTNGAVSLKARLQDSTFVGPVVRHLLQISDEHSIVVEEPSSLALPREPGEITLSWNHEAGTLLKRESSE